MHVRVQLDFSWFAQSRTQPVKWSCLSTSRWTFPPYIRKSFTDRPVGQPKPADSLLRVPSPTILGCVGLTVETITPHHLSLQGLLLASGSSLALWISGTISHSQNVMPLNVEGFFLCFVFPLGRAFNFIPPISLEVSSILSRFVFKPCEDRSRKAFFTLGIPGLTLLRFGLSKLSTRGGGCGGTCL